LWRRRAGGSSAGRGWAGRRKVEEGDVEALGRAALNGLVLERWDAAKASKSRAVRVKWTVALARASTTPLRRRRGEELRHSVASSFELLAIIHKVEQVDLAILVPVKA
jgi:hypothetical protein